MGQRIGLMFLYSQYSLHVERLGLRSFAPARLIGLRAGAELGSPISLRQDSESKQRSSRELHGHATPISGARKDDVRAKRSDT